jgi:hypothetical protein
MKILFVLVFLASICSSKPIIAVDQPPKEKITIAAVEDLMIGGKAYAKYGTTFDLPRQDPCAG